VSPVGHPPAYQNTCSHAPPKTGQLAILSPTVLERGPKRLVKHIVIQQIAYLAIDETCIHKRGVMQMQHIENVQSLTARYHHTTNVTIDETYIHRACAKHRTIAVAHLPRHTILPIRHHRPGSCTVCLGPCPARMLHLITRQIRDWAIQHFTHHRLRTWARTSVETHCKPPSNVPHNR
jgi:hypothetical protein